MDWNRRIEALRILIGERRRLGRPTSYKTLAREIGCSVQQLGEWRDGAIPSVAMGEKIAEAEDRFAL